MPRTSRAIQPVQALLVLLLWGAQTLAQAAELPAAPAPGEPGVTDTEILVGMSAAFSSPARKSSIDLYRGAQAAFAVVNAAGGVHGRHITLKAYDDGYQPDRAVLNTRVLLEQDRVFLLFNYFGTATATAVVPLLKKRQADNVYLLFPYSGAGVLRTPPYESLVYTAKVSYRREIKGMVDNLVKVGRKRVAVFYQQDAYGRDGWEALRAALSEHHLQMVAEASYSRNATYEQHYDQQVAVLQAATPDVVITVGVNDAVAGFIRDARDAGLTVPIANLSPAALADMLPMLTVTGTQKHRDYTANLIASRIVPSFENTELAAVRDFRAAVASYPSLPPMSLTVTPYPPVTDSDGALEGYLNAKLLVEVLQRLGPQPSRARLAAAIEGISHLDIGIGEDISFSAQRHQGRDGLYYSTLFKGVVQPFTDWSAWQK
jgi:ABC-type branched-subunit amino acid transport system substrate-binding protein